MKHKHFSPILLRFYQIIALCAAFAVTFPSQAQDTAIETNAQTADHDSGNTDSTNLPASDTEEFPLPPKPPQPATASDANTSDSAQNVTEATRISCYVMDGPELQGPFSGEFIVDKMDEGVISHQAFVKCTNGENLDVQWKAAYAVFFDKLKPHVPRISVRPRFGLFRAPFVVNVDGVDYLLKKKTRYIGQTVNYIEIEVTGFLYPKERINRLGIPPEIRNGRDYPNYFWQTPIGQHIFSRQVNLGKIGAMQISRTYLVGTLGFTGALIGLIPIMLHSSGTGSSRWEFDETDRNLFIAGGACILSAALFNLLFRKAIGKAYRRLETHY